MKIQVFTKFFYPNKQNEANININISDSEEEEDKQQNNKRDSDLKSIDGSSLISTSRNKEISTMVKHIESVIREKVSNNWVSVRKAFLDIDDNFDGFITAEDLAKLIGGASGANRYDFNLIKMLINLRNQKKNSKLNYTEFCAWLGGVIEPAENFYFRHDSQKNP